MGSHFPLQGIFPTQGLNWHLLHCRPVLYTSTTCEALVMNTMYISPSSSNVFLLGHTVAKQVYYTSKKKDSSKWLPALHFFEIALKLARTSGTEEHEVEAEIFFQKGKMYLESQL